MEIDKNYPLVQTEDPHVPAVEAVIAGLVVPAGQGIQSPLHQ
jgi:hypothetical protein